MFKSTIKLEDLFIFPYDSLYRALEVIDKTGANTTKAALIVDENKKLIGLINDGDIRRALLKKAPMNDPVSKHMTKDFIYVKENTSRLTVLERIKAFSVSQLPVLNDLGHVVGIHFLSDFIMNRDIDNIAVIMAGGKGVRLKPITEHTPKPMIKVAGKPILEHILHHLVGFGVKNFYFAVNYKADIIKEYFGNGESFGCLINYINEDKPLGTAGALSMLPRIENDLILMNGDLITQFNVIKMLEMHSYKKNHITLGVKDHVQRIPYGVLNVSEGQVTEVVEKPEEHYLVNGGVYILKPEVLDLVPKNKMFFATDLIEKSIKLKSKVGYYFLDDDWIDIGEHEQLHKALGNSK